MIDCREKLTPLCRLQAGGRAPVSFSTVIAAVHDGDTATCIHSDGVSDTVRLTGIDAPELLQAGGAAAQKALSDFVLGKQVIIETRWRDARGRLLGRILVENIDVNLQMLQTGMAWAFYLQNVDASIRPAYQSAFDNSRANKTGIFSDPNAVPPSEWRKTHGVK